MPRTCEEKKDFPKKLYSDSKQITDIIKFGMKREILTRICLKLHFLINSDKR